MPLRSRDYGLTPGLSQQEILNGWLSLFDGETLFGWKAVTDANWHVDQGEIRVDSGTSGLLRTTTQFDDFELILEFKCGAQTNSGIFLRTSPEPRNPVTDCYELNIANRRDHDFPTGSLVKRVATKLDFPTGTWHQVRVLADGARIQSGSTKSKRSITLIPNRWAEAILAFNSIQGPSRFAIFVSFR